jgi:hypothetical protein
MSRDSSPSATHERSLAQALLGDGRPLLYFTAVCLLLSGGFVIFQASTGHFLPHDADFLGMTAKDLCKVNACRVVHFMIHDRVAFGGVLLAIAALYLYLVDFPLWRGEAWAWALLFVSGTWGFLSFLAYLGYGYLDTWHGAATVALLPCFAVGLWRSRPAVGIGAALRDLFTPAVPFGRPRAWGVGRIGVFAAGVGILFAGLTITGVGMTVVFVPQDLVFMGLSVADLRAANERLIPLIAHDRAGFGGGVMCCGILVSLLGLRAARDGARPRGGGGAGGGGGGAAIGVHPAVGYNSFIHIAPAYVGAAVFFLGIATWTSAGGPPAGVAPPPTAKRPAGFAPSEAQAV